MAVAEHNDSGNTTYQDFKSRVRAWWDGNEIEDFSRPRHPGGNTTDVLGTKPTQVEETAPTGKPAWTATRLQVIEHLWGTDFIGPGALDYVPHLITVLGLGGSMSVIDYACGLGGATRQMASKGAWVLGLESAPDLCQEAMRRSVSAGMKKKAMIMPFDPENFTSSKRVDAFFSKEGFFAVHDKDKLFDAIVDCLKPGGQVLFTDFCLADGITPGSEIHDWVRHERRQPSLWSFSRMIDALEMRRLDLRIREDMTATYKGAIHKALNNFVLHLEDHDLDGPTRRNVMDEVQLWLHRMRALGHGLRCCRFHALKPLA